MIKQNSTLITLFLILSTTLALQAQEQIAIRPSPLAIVSAKYKDTYVKITYSQPQKKGREIFGSLVPFGQVWRTGANEATEITITKDIFISGKLLAAGTYSLFTIPEKEKWTIILNKEPGLWGSYNYNVKMDLMRFEVSAQSMQNAVYEAFTIVIDQKNNKAEILLLWDKTKVAFPIDFIEPKL
ncbi:MAG TPA: DUF2911 domain-containing protein [Cyclobacteriaceae bacterium]